jgi:beta-phosphoglucomutase family hydrolase
VRGCLFDLDGVVTRTAEVHAAAWKEMFDEYLLAVARRAGTPFIPFDIVSDYDAYVDGRSREDGARAFLASRNITLPEGAAGEAPGAESIYGLSSRKNDAVLRRIAEDGVAVYDGSVRYIRAIRAHGLSCAVVSASVNCQSVLAAAGIEDLFDQRIDGLTARRDHLKGKPAPDMFLAGARALGLLPSECAVFEDALSGVEAGRAGAFARVIGVDRAGQTQELREHGADTVVSDLAELMDTP